MSPLCAETRTRGRGCAFARRKSSALQRQRRRVGRADEGERHAGGDALLALELFQRALRDLRLEVDGAAGRDLERARAEAQDLFCPARLELALGLDSDD